MTHDQLNERFSTTGTTPADFIQWAAGHGVKVHHATVSRHRAGTQAITGPWKLAYLWFFSRMQNEKAEIYPLKICSIDPGPGDEPFIEIMVFSSPKKRQAFAEDWRQSQRDLFRDQDKDDVNQFYSTNRIHWIEFGDPLMVDCTLDMDGNVEKRY